MTLSKKTPSSVDTNKKWHPAELTPSNVDTNQNQLKRAYVMLDAAERRDMIWNEATTQAFALGLEVIEDSGLLAEVAGLVEWPVVLMENIKQYNEDTFADADSDCEPDHFYLQEMLEDKFRKGFIMVNLYYRGHSIIFFEF